MTRNRLKSAARQFALASVGVALAGLGFAQASGSAASTPPVKLRASDLGVYVFGRSGQSTTQQAKDDGECYGAAAQQSNYDQRMAQAAQSPAPAPTQQGARAKGAVKGAVAGTAIGAVAGDAGEGAAIGATAGVIAAGSRQRRENKEAQQRAAQAVEQEKANALADLKRAYGACMDARGYSVK